MMEGKNNMLNFKISELIHSDTAIKHNIRNIPDINSVDCMLDLIYYVLQPLRDKLAKPIIIASGFRNAEVNKLVGGAPNSQHLKGQAADLVVNGMTPQELFTFIINSESHISYDQAIWEKDKNCVHISYAKGKNRHEALIREENGICYRAKNDFKIIKSIF